MKKKILLVEDDPGDALIFKLALEESRLAADFICVSNAKELFAFLRKELPSIIFLDIDMPPGKNGITCIEEIRRNAMYHDIPLVMYSGYDEEDKIKEAMKAGADLFLKKNDSLFDLGEKLQNIFATQWKCLRYHRFIRSINKA
jgi:CheY-like chemotaxis protein